MHQLGGPLAITQTGWVLCVTSEEAAGACRGGSPVYRLTNSKIAASVLVCCRRPCRCAEGPSARQCAFVWCLAAGWGLLHLALYARLLRLDRVGADFAARQRPNCPVSGNVQLHPARCGWKMLGGSSTCCSGGLLCGSRSTGSRRPKFAAGTQSGQSMADRCPDRCR